MEKIEVKTVVKNISFEYGLNTIEVNPIIGIQSMDTLKNTYLTALFKEDGEWDEQLAEFLFRRGVISLQTNIDIEKVTEIPEVDNLVWGKLYKEIVSHIYNYEDVYKSIMLSVSNKVEKYKIEKSTGKVLEGIIAYVTEIIDGFKNLKPEDIEKMKTEASGLMEQMKQSPIANILNDTKKEKKTRKKKEYVQ